MTVCHLFVGPSGAGVPALADAPPDLRILPPVKRGDLPSLARSEPPGAIALADGIFHSHPAVGHKEILQALHAGWKIYGLCSLGALRACEMFSFGMVPFGRVAQRYVEAPETPDDFVALLHGPGPRYLLLSEPYVHLESCLEHACSSGLLSSAEKLLVQQELTESWYGHRTMERFRALLLKAAPDRPRQDQIAGLLAEFDRFRIKNQDLSDFVTQRPWAEQQLTAGDTL